MLLLKVAITTHDGYQKIIKEVKHADNDNDDACKISLTEHDIFFIWKKALFILTLYQYCKEEMPQKTFMDCCQQTVHKLSKEQGWRIKNSTQFTDGITNFALKIFLWILSQNKVKRTVSQHSFKMKMSRKLFGAIANQILMFSPPIWYGSIFWKKYFRTLLHTQTFPTLMNQTKPSRRRSWTRTNLRSWRNTNSFHCPSPSSTGGWAPWSSNMKHGKNIVFVDGHEKDGTKNYRKKYVKKC